MSAFSEIEWTDATWNPTRGCTKISSGCRNCYAETFAERFRGIPGHPFEHGFDLQIINEKLIEPLKWKKPRKIFVNSMSDLFHKEIPDEFIIKVFSVMEMADWHTFQILTKRPERMKKLFNGKLRKFATLKNIWLGVSVENRNQGLPRIDILRKVDIQVRFLSIEPLLEDLGEINLKNIDWVIVGGESGPHSRPMESDWVLSIREQCQVAKVPFFFKQWGGTRKHLSGRSLSGRYYNEMPHIWNREKPAQDEIQQKLENAANLI